VSGNGQEIYQLGSYWRDIIAVSVPKAGVGVELRAAIMKRLIFGVVSYSKGLTLKLPH